MGIAFVQQKVANAVSTTVSATFDTTPASGSLVVVSIGWKWFPVQVNISSVSDNAGNTYYQAGGDLAEVGLSCRIWYAYDCAVTTGHQVTVSFDASTTCELHISEWSGASFVHSPFSTASAWMGTVLTAPYSVSTGPVTAEIDGALYIAQFRKDDAYTLDGEPAGMTPLTDATEYLKTYYLIQGTRASINATSSYTSAATVACRIAAFLPEHHSSASRSGSQSASHSWSAGSVPGVTAPSSAVLSRNTDLPSQSAFTLMGWFWGKDSALSHFFIGNSSGYSQSYVECYFTGTESGFSRKYLVIDCYDKVTDDWYTTRTGAGPGRYQWWHWAYVRSGASHTLYLSSADRVTFDCGVAAQEDIDVALTPAYLALSVDDDQGMKEIRAWTAALTPAEIRLERESTTAVRVADLYSDTPFQNDSDILDVSGNGRHWTVTGTLYNYNPPLYIPDDYVTVSALPATYAENTVGREADYASWYAYTAQTGDQILSVLAFCNIISNFKPTIDVFTGPRDDPYPHPLGYIPDAIQCPLQVPLRDGETYYFRITQTPYTPTYPLDADLTVTFTQKPDSEVPVGSVFITDDTDGYPSMFMSATDGTVLAYLDMRSSDLGVALPSGYFCLQYGRQMDRPGWVAIYDPELNIVSTPNIDAKLYQVSHNGNDKFYISSNDWSTAGSTGHISTLTVDGTLDYARWRIPVAYVRGLAPSWDDTVLYYTAGSTVGRWDLVNDIALSQFRPAVTSYAVNRDILVLADGSVIIGYTWGVAATYDKTCYVERWSPGGALLNTYGPYDGVLDRMCAGNDDPDSLWVWTFTAARMSQFRQIATSDGTVLTTFSAPNSVCGHGPVWDPAYPDGDPPAFSHSNSCSLLVLRQPISISASPSVAPPIEERIRLIRRMRQSPHLTDEQVWLLFSQFQLDLETGLGATSGQGANPQVMLQWSNNSGRTWSNEHWVTAGRMGKYQLRAIWRRLGRGRQRVWRVVVSDPVAWKLLGAYVQVEKGAS